MTKGLSGRPDELTRPRVIVSITATVDGRITLSRAERLLDDRPQRRWRDAWPEDAEAVLAQRAAAMEHHHPTVTLEGSGSFVADGAESLDLPESVTAAEELQQDFVPRDSPRWFAVVDGRGRVAWTKKGDDETCLLVIVSASTPLPYVAYLRRERIPYLIAGDVRVDLETALVKLRSRLGATCVVSEGGGGLNGALLRAGLVDELHVVTIPGLVGGLGTPSMFDGPPLPPGSSPLRLRTIDVNVGPHGTSWAHYEVTAAPSS